MIYRYHIIFLRKVLLNVGLCIALKDITKLGDAIILPGDGGASHSEVHFRYIVFRPNVGDIITGKIRSCSREGVHSELSINTNNISFRRNAFFSNSYTRVFR